MVVVKLGWHDGSVCRRRLGAAGPRVARLVGRRDGRRPTLRDGQTPPGSGSALMAGSYLARWAWWPPEHAGAAAGAGAWEGRVPRAIGAAGEVLGRPGAPLQPRPVVWAQLFLRPPRFRVANATLRRPAAGKGCKGASVRRCWRGGPGPKEAMCGAAGGACELRASHNALRGRFSQCTHWATAIRLSTVV